MRPVGSERNHALSARSKAFHRRVRWRRFLGGLLEGNGTVWGLDSNRECGLYRRFGRRSQAPGDGKPRVPPWHGLSRSSNILPKELAPGIGGRESLRGQLRPVPKRASTGFQGVGGRLPRLAGSQWPRASGSAQLQAICGPNWPQAVAPDHTWAGGVSRRV